MRTLIVGAGIAGLSTAVRLRQLGLPATVAEEASGPRGGGYMIDFFGLGIAAADRLGLRPELERIHSPVRRLAFVDERGAMKYSVDYAALRRRMFGGQHYNFLRGDLERVLHRAACTAGVGLAYGRQVVAVTPAASPGQPVVVRYGDGTDEEWDAVLGADGLHSRVRASTLRPSEWCTRDLGYAFWAWIVDGHLPGLPPEEFTVLTAPRRMVAGYPAGAHRTAVFFLLRCGDRGGEPADEQPGVLATLFGDLGGQVPALLATLPDAVDRYTDRSLQIRADAWHRGRVALLGDACWCVSLVAGQGASLAMAGGAAVAEEIATSPDDITAALDRYRARWQPVTDQLAASGTRTATWFAPERRWRMSVRDVTMRASAWPLIGPALGRRLGFASVTR